MQAHLHTWTTLLLIIGIVMMTSSDCNAQLSLLPGFPVETNSRVFGSAMCTKSSDEIYAVCGSAYGIAIKYNLQPVSLAAKGPSGGNFFTSGGLYESSFQSTSRFVCAQLNPPTILFLRVSDMTQITHISLPVAFSVVVDTPNQVAYVTNYNVFDFDDTPATIYKIINIDTSSPSVAGNVTWGINSGDQNPCALVIVGDFLYAHLNIDVGPARLARIRISNFSHDATVQFFGEEYGGQYDNLANDNNFIYDLTQEGIIVRCTYQNNNFARFDSLNTGFTSTYSLSISPDLQTLFFTASDQNAAVLVDAKTFALTMSTSSIVPSAFGRPIVMSNGIFYAFSQNNDQVYGFKYCPSNATYGGNSKVPCPAGYFCPDPNATSPTPCGPGKFTPSKGWCFAQTCPAGFFCPSISTTSPQNCTSGRFCPQGSSQPMSCPAGSFCPSGSTASITCACGSYCPHDSVSPTICPNGTYTADSTTPCSICPVNFYCPTSATCTPVLCPIFAVCPPGSSGWQSSLIPLPDSPINTSSGVTGTMQCTKISDEIYAVCGSSSGSAVKYNLQPFSFAATGPPGGIYNAVSCDISETSSQSTSRVVCAQQTQQITLFIRLSDMTQTASVYLPNSFYVVVDTPNQVAYVSGNNVAPATIYKIISIDTSSPIVAANVTWGQESGDQYPCALLIVGVFLYAHLEMNPSRLARIRISSFSHDDTIPFLNGEFYGENDNLANDNFFIYDLTQQGIIVRCTYQNNNFARFDSLNTGFTSTYSLSISPDLHTLFFTASDQNAVVLVNVTAFAATLSTGPIIPSAFGRPIVMSNGIFYAFSQNNDQVYGFKYCPANATYGGSSKLSCPAGYFCPDPNATSPTPCGPGKYTPSEGWCSCLLCQEGFFCPSNNTVDPVPCPAGFYCPTTASSSILCPCGSFCPSGSAAPTACDAGTFNPSNGSTSNASCSTCPATAFCDSGSCSRAVCPCGSFCPSGSTQPSSCDAGTFNPSNGSSSITACKVCTVGAYCPVASCSPVGCPCGMFCPEAGATNCTPGYYSSDPSFFCSLCPEGFYCPLDRTCSPIPCGENHYCPPGSPEPLRTVLLQLPHSPIVTKSGITGTMQCTKDSDEIYAVCGSFSGSAVKYNLQPFSFSATGPPGGTTAVSCDLYETSTQPTSRVVCTQSYPSAILFLQLSDMTQTARIPVAAAYYVAVDTPNQVAYVSNYNVPATIYKIINIDTSSPSVVGNVTWGQNNGDQNPFALRIVGDCLFAHLDMNPARLARISIMIFEHDETVPFVGEEYGGQYDNLANDNNFIYDLTQNGILVRCIYRNDNFQRVDSLVTIFTSTYSLSISPDLKTLFFTAFNQNEVVLVNVTAFSQTLATGPIIPSAFGRPIVTSNGIFYAFSQDNDEVYGFKYCPVTATYGGSSNLPCPAGHFCPDPNATSPTPCGPGTYSPSSGFCVCPPCPPGAYCPSTGSNITQSCPIGTYNPTEGASTIAGCLPCPLDKICQEGSVAPLECSQQNCGATRTCTLYSKVLVGVTDAQPYCVVSDHSTCPSPLTCSSINLRAYDVSLQCVLAGCRYSGGTCVNQGCFNLFLPSFVIQPFGLMFIGFAKDVVVLLLIGIFGDVLMRKVTTMMLRFKFWQNKWNREKIEALIEETVYVNDARCRNETSTNEESFEEYCERIEIALFELPETDDEEIRKNRKRRLIDAITFSMFDSGLWFELDEIEENNNKKQEEIIQQVQEINEQEESETIEHQNEISKQTFSPKNDEPISESRNSDHEEGEKDDSQEVANDRRQPEEKIEEEFHQEENQNAESQLQNDQEEVTSENAECEEQETTVPQSQQTRRKLILSPESFATTSTLQQFVNAHITSHAQCVVYFASSRDWQRRAAAAMNNFPSTLQLFYYIASVIIFVALTFRDVVLDSTNQKIIETVSSYTCGSAQSHSANKTTYLLLGFRLLNSSSTATVILIFIKTLHAIYSSSSERFKQLQLPQRLPILGLLTSKSTQILLIFYFLVVSSFALAGVTYGLRIIPCLVVVVIAAALLILDSAVLNLVRHFASKRTAKEVAERDRILQCVATQELPLLGLNSETGAAHRSKQPVAARSRNSLYTEDDHLLEQEEFDIITAVEAFEAAKQSVLNPAPTALPQALLVFLLREEIPTIILAIALQLCFNYICLFEFGEAFGVADQRQLPNTEYEARKFSCIWGMFKSDVSSKISVLTSFVGFL